MVLSLVRPTSPVRNRPTALLTDSTEYVQDISRCGLPQLTPAQYTKLRELSLLSYVRYPHNLTYPKLMELLLIKTIPELEEVVMTAIYNGLLHGRLDPHGQRVAVTSVAPLRDVPPSDIASLQDILQEWSERCTSTLGDLERQIQGIKEDAVKRKKGQDEWEEYYEGLVNGDKKGGKKGTARSTRGMKRGMFGMGGGSRVREEEVDVDMMEDDDDGEMVASTSPRSSRSKRGKGFMGLGKKN